MTPSPSPLVINFLEVVVVVVAELDLTVVVAVALVEVMLEMRFLIGLPLFVGRLIGASVVRVAVVVVVVVVFRAAATADALDDVAVVARFAIGATVALEIGTRAVGLCEILRMFLVL